MVYLSDFTEETEKPMRKVHFPIAFTVKINWEINKEIALIGLFENKKPSTWARDILVEKIHTYLRNPQYLKFKRQLQGIKNEER